MKKLENSLFQKFENDRIIQLAKIIGGAPQQCTWTQGGSSGCDTIDFDTKQETVYDEKGNAHSADVAIVPCEVS